MGDRVLSFDDNTKTTAYKNVVQLFRNQTKELVHIYTNGEEIVCTNGHPFYVENKGWVKAQDLIITDTLQLDDGAQVSINDLRTETLEQEVTVYNFEVEDNHTYYVSESNVLCHNMCKNPNHGNSLTTKKKTELYVLKDKNTKAIRKIGETTRGTKRYTKKFYLENNVKMEKLYSGTKAAMRKQETAILKSIRRNAPDIFKGLMNKGIH